LIEQIDRLATQAQRLAQSSGGMVNPSYFGGIRSASSMACGDLDRLGLWDRSKELVPAKEAST
jgi:hypothetical protein